MSSLVNVQKAIAAPAVATLPSPAAEVKCSQCQKTLEKISRCGFCKAPYCDRTCQSKDWPEHKKVCSLPPSKKEPEPKAIFPDAVVTPLEISGVKVAAYKSPIVKDGARHKFFFTLFDLVLKAIEIKAKKYVVMPKEAKSPAHSVNPPDNVVYGFYLTIKGWFADSDEVFGKTMVEKTGLNEAELIATLDESYAIFKKFIRDSQTQQLLTFSSKDDEAGMEQRIGSLTKAAFIFFYRDCGTMVNLGVAAYPKDFTLTDRPETLKLPSAETMSCGQYALAISEKQLDYRQFVESSEECGHFLWWLKRGYKPVDDPKEGDVVVYFYERDQTIRHVGVLAQNGRVRSKPGIKHDIAYEHPWAAYMGTYGNRIALLRRGG